MSEYAESAAEACRVGARILLPLFRHLEPSAVTEKARNDFVSRADKESEEAIRSYLAGRHPTHGLLGEEGGYQPFGGGPAVGEWIVDPLDGTANFIHGYPCFAVSVGLRIGGEVVAGAVLDPLRDELFVAEKGSGAFRNGERIRTSRKSRMAEAFTATGFPFRAREQIDRYLAVFKEVFLAGRAIRRAGSAALDLAYVAGGIFDAFFEFRLSVWDLAAGTLLCREAGGIVTDGAGGQDFLETGDVVAGAKDIQPHLLELVLRHPEQ